METFQGSWKGSHHQLDLLRQLNGQIDLAMVIDWLTNGGGLHWIQLPIPVLDDLKPLDCLNDDLLLKRLRTALMRFPA